MAKEVNRSGDGVPYDRGWSWMVVLGINMMHVFLIGYIKTFGLLFVELQERFQLSSQQTAWVSTAMLLTIDILSPLGTGLGDQFGSRTVVMVGGCVVCIALVLSSLLINIHYMVGVMGGLFGIGATLCYAPSMIMVGYYFKRRLGLANALSVTGSSVGQFFMPPIVTILLEQYSLCGTLLILGGIMFNLTLGGALLRPVSFYERNTRGEKYEESSLSSSQPSSSDTEKPLVFDKMDEKSTSDDKFRDKTDLDIYQQIKQPHSASDLNEDENPLNTEHGNEISDTYARTMLYASAVDLHCSMTLHTSTITMHKLRRRGFSGFLNSVFNISLLKNPVYVIFALGCCLASFSYIGMFRYLPAHCKDLGIHEHHRAMLLSLVGIVDLISRLLVGLIADTNFIRIRFKRYRLLALALVLSGANAMILVYAQQFWQIVLSCVLYGAFGGVHMTLLSVTLVDLLGAENLSRAWGIMLLLYSVTTIGEPLVLGYLRDTTGYYSASFLTCAASFVVGGLLVLVAPSAKSKSKPAVESEDSC